MTVDNYVLLPIHLSKIESNKLLKTLFVHELYHNKTDQNKRKKTTIQVNTHSKDVPGLIKAAEFAQGPVCQQASLVPLGYHEPV